MRGIRRRFNVDLVKKEMVTAAIMAMLAVPGATMASCAELLQIPYDRVKSIRRSQKADRER
jgi:hypothetical protein